MAVILFDDAPEQMPEPLAVTYWCESCQKEATGICQHYEQASEMVAADEEPLDVVLLHTRG